MKQPVSDQRDYTRSNIQGSLESVQIANFERNVKMNNKTTIIILLATAVMQVGCATTDIAKISYESRIKAAHSHLQNGAFGRAMYDLESAAKTAQQKGYDQTQLKCLLAEMYLGRGDTLEAYHQAKELLEKNDRDPYANELLGKIYLKEGGFLGAEQYFLTAQAEYESADDVSRVKDLVALARGLSAYEAGSPRLADRYWQEIKNPDLQYSLGKAQKETTLVSSNNERRW